jgi:Rrf2 family transcriptional regulator, iron-sulfur cluster assembly transcription factor
MSLLRRNGLLAATAVLDVALHADHQPVASKALAERLRLPPRYLEPVLQALVRHSVLKGIRGPHGGYQLGRAANQITAEDIARAIRTIDDEEEEAVVNSTLLTRVVVPMLTQAEVAFFTALARINVEDLVRAAKMVRRSAA